MNFNILINNYSIYNEFDNSSISPNNVSNQYVFKDLNNIKNKMNNTNMPPILQSFISSNYYSYVIYDLELLNDCMNFLSLNNRMDVIYDQNNFDYNITLFTNEIYCTLNLKIFSVYDENNQFKNYKIDIINTSSSKFKDISNNYMIDIENLLFSKNLINKKKCKSKSCLLDIKNSVLFDDNDGTEKYFKKKKEEIKKYLNSYLNLFENEKYSEQLLCNLISFRKMCSSKNFKYFSFAEFIIFVKKLINIFSKIYNLENKSIDYYYYSHYLRNISSIYKEVIFYYKNFNDDIYIYLNNMLNLNVLLEDNEFDNFRYNCNKAETKRNCIRIIKFLKDKNCNFNFDKVKDIIEKIIENNICENLVDMCKKSLK
jgi:hypothetical protein